MNEGAGHGQGIIRHHRALFLSDLHLGTLGCRADLVFSFLEQNTADTLYLVGDIFDLWDPLVIRWGAEHDRILSLLRARADAGTKLFYLAGNHDKIVLSELHQDPRTDLPVVPQAAVTHVTADGRRYLVLHGDICDARILRLHLLTRVGSRLDSMLRLLDGGLRRLRLRFGPDGRGPVELLLSAVNDVLYRGRKHERRLVALARSGGHDGVICGHFHIAALHCDFGLIYANCGDWVDSFTAITEAADGALQLISLPLAEAAQAAPVAIAAE